MAGLELSTNGPGFEVSSEARRSISVAMSWRAEKRHHSSRECLSNHQQRVAHAPRKAEACEVDLRWPARRRPGVTHSAGSQLSDFRPLQLSNLSPPLTSRRVDAAGSP